MGSVPSAERITDPPKWGEVNCKHVGTFWVYMTSEFCRISGSRRSRQKLQNPSEYVELEEFDASLRNRIGWTVGPGQVSHQVVAWLGKYLR